jgi:hypothetical protein
VPTTVICFRRGTTPGGRDLAGRGHQRHLVARAHAHGAGQLAAQHHTKLAGHQRSSAASAWLLARSVTSPFLGRVNAAHHHAFHVLTARQQGLGCYKRCSTQHLRVGLGLGQGAATSGRRAAGAEKTSMCETTPSMRSRTSF